MFWFWNASRHLTFRNFIFTYLHNLYKVFLPQNYAAYPQKNTHVDVQIQWKPVAITVKSQVSSGALPRIHHIPLEHHSEENLGVNTSYLYNILDMRKEGGGGVIQVFQLRGTRNEINRKIMHFTKFTLLFRKNA